MNIYYTYNQDDKNLVQAKRTIDVNGQTIILGSAEDFAKYLNAYQKGNLPPPTPPEGKQAIPSGYELVDGKWETTWKFEDLPAPAPRRFSKMYLELALFNMGVLDQIDAFIDSQSITNDFGQQMPLRRLYDKALVFSEDNQYFNQYLNVIKTQLSLSDEQVEQILQSCITED